MHLVIGAPKSGTQWYTLVLRDKTGLDFGHERIGRDGCVSSYLTVDDYFYHGPHGGSERRRDISPSRVTHLVRNPADCIPSISRMKPGWWRWQEKHTGISIDDFTRIEAASRFWCAWTSLAARQSSETVRVEDVDHDDHSREIGHTADKPGFSLDDITRRSRRAVEKAAIRYGYSF